MTDKLGLAGVVADLPASALRLPFADAEQLELIRDEQPGRDAGAAVQAARRGGRAPGVPNKRTAEMRAYLLRRYPHPLEALAQLYSRPVEVLAAELGCTLLEAATLAVKAAAEVAPFVEGKMPIAIDLTARSDLTLIIPGLNAPVGGVEDVARLLTIEARAKSMGLASDARAPLEQPRWNAHRKPL